MTSSYKLTYSTELMDNYKQSEIISPQKKFRAVQTDDGMALLFSIGTDNVFYLIEQQTGHATGWEKIDLSSSLRQQHGDQPLAAKTFAVAQNVSTQLIDLALAVTVDGQDYLYLSLGNPSSGKALSANSIQWVEVPFDDPEHKGIKLDITNLFISESKFDEYIVADISQSTFKKNPTNYLSRYYIKPPAPQPKKNAPSSPPIQSWNPMSIGGELDPGAQSCLGRVSGDRVDGIYTLGKISAINELLYAPLYNAFDPNAPVTIRRLKMPDGASALSAASSPSDNKATDLYVAAEGALYYFAANNQEDQATGVAVSQHKLFSGVSNLYAINSGDNIIVWGLNASSDQIFYTSCPSSKIAEPDAWSFPVPIMSGVEQVAPYINRGNSANTFFAHTGTGELTVAVKSPDTTVWNRRQIALPPTNTKQKAQKFRSYTTRIQVTDQFDQPVANVPVNLSSQSDTSVYINHLYHVIGSSPIQVTTDTLGTITVIDAVSSLNGAQIDVSLAADQSGVKDSINPMEKPFKSAAKLTTVSQLNDATITYQNGKTKPLVKTGASQNSLNATASANQALSQAYDHVTGASKTTTQLATANSMLASSSADSIWVDAGDLLSWIEHELEDAAEVVWDAAKSAWTFVVNIAGKVYSAILDCVETVVSAMQTVYNAIITAITDLVDFLKFLFDLDDIKRTKEVMQNIAVLYFKQQIDEIEVVKSEFDGKIDAAEKAINNWAGRGDLSGLGKDGSTALQSTSTPASHNSAPGAMLSHHFQNNAQNSSMANPPAPPGPPSNPVTVLLNALEKEWDTLGAAFDALVDLGKEAGSMSPEQLVKQLIAILGDTVLESTKIVVDALFDVVYDLSKAALAVFEAPIHIPVVSDILSEFGVPEFSFLDVICWIGAVPATMIYKIAEGKAPFAADQQTQTLIDATNFRDLASAFPGQQTGTLAAVPQTPMLAAVEEDNAKSSSLVPISESTANAVFILSHVFAGLSGVFSAVFDAAEAAEETGENDWVIPSAVSAIVGGGLQVGANFLVPKDPIESTAINWIYRGTSCIRVLCKAIFSGPGQEYLGGTARLNRLQVADARGVGAVVDSVLVIPALVCSCWHFYELSEKSSDVTRTQAILDESSNMAAYLGRVSYAVAVNTEAEVKAGAIVVLVIADILYGGLQLAESPLS